MLAVVQGRARCRAGACSLSCRGVLAVVQGRARCRAGACSLSCWGVLAVVQGWQQQGWEGCGRGQQKGVL
jgi:hypothetical protein